MTNTAFPSLWGADKTALDFLRVGVLAAWGLLFVQGMELFKLAL